MTFCVNNNRAMVMFVSLVIVLAIVTGQLTDVRLPGRLEGSVYMTLYTMGENQCEKECVARKKCLSVNYKRQSLTCQLNADNDKTDLIEEYTWIYMEKSDLIKTYGNQTCYEECPQNTKCVFLSSQQSVCAVTECIDPPDVAHASVSDKKVVVSEETVYTCNTNYYRIGQGSGRLTCKADGTFTDNNFECELKPCTTPGTLPKADVTSYDLAVGGNAIYSCHYGYSVVNGPASVTCELGGTWSVAQFSCDEIPCSSPSTVSHASTSSYQTSVGSEAIYSCDYGYVMSGTGTRTCQLGGSWSTVTFSCNEKPCSTPPSVSHADLTSYSTSVGSRAYYNCHFGYGTSEDKFVLCQFGGSWSGVSFQCKFLGLFG